MLTPSGERQGGQAWAGECGLPKWVGGGVRPETAPLGAGGLHIPTRLWGGCALVSEMSPRLSAPRAPSDRPERALLRPSCQ